MPDEIKDETANFVTTSSDMPVVDTTTTDTDDKKPAGEGKTSEQDKSKVEEDAGTIEKAEKKSDEENNSPDKLGKSDDLDTTADADKAKKHKSAQKRIDKAVREREDEKRAHEATKRELARIKSEKTEKEKGPKPKEPVEGDFDTYDEYLTASEKYEAEKKKVIDSEVVDQKSDKTSKDEGSESDLTDAQRTAMAVLKEKTSDVDDRYSDFDKVALADDVEITGDMLEALAECDDPAKVMMHLGQNKDLSTDIAGKSPAQQSREIAKLDLTVDAKPPKPTKTTKAAEPIVPVAGTDAQEKAVGDMSFKEYEAHQNKVEHARRSNSGW